MQNTLLRDRTAADIDARVAKVLRDLGNPYPPLRLAEVRELLRLDRQYYSTAEDGPIREFVHRMKMSGKQIVMRPTLLIDVVKKCSLKALYLPDRKRILLDSDLPALKQRWGEGQEIGHAIIPWHEGLTLGDSKQTLSVECNAQLEAEANYAAGQLLFLQDQFAERLASYPLNLTTIRSIAKAFGNSITTTLWRTVEHLEVPCVALVSQHPRIPGANFDPANPCRYFVRSRAFAEQFPGLTEAHFFPEVRRYCGSQRAGHLGSAELTVVDQSRQKHLFMFETFFNRYEALTLGVYDRLNPTCVAL